jgi:hypothetical protein
MLNGGVNPFANAYWSNRYVASSTAEPSGSSQSIGDNSSHDLPWDLVRPAEHLRILILTSLIRLKFLEETQFGTSISFTSTRSQDPAFPNFKEFKPAPNYEAKCVPVAQLMPERVARKVSHARNQDRVRFEPRYLIPDRVPGVLLSAAGRPSKSNSTPTSASFARISESDAQA